MIRSRALAFSCLLLFASAAQARSAPTKKEKIESGGRERVCHVYRPASLAVDAKTPLILLLHGSGRRGPSILNTWKRLADEEGILLAAPDSFDEEVWRIPADGPQFLGDVIRALRDRYPIDAKRIYLFGHSAGAEFTLRMAPMESELFAAAGAHAGAFIEAGASTILAFASRKIPLLLIVGNRDPYYPVDIVRRTTKMFEERGFPIESVEIPRHDHDYYRLAGSINRQVWDFLSTKQLEKDAHYTPYSIDVDADGRVSISTK